jgi:hypothetical protein
MVLKPRPVILACFAFSSVLALFAGARSIPKQDRSWKRYYNPQWGYCVSYPSRWLRGDAFEGAGIYLETGVKKHSMPLGEIDIGVLPGHPDTQGLKPRLSLVDHMQVHLDGLKRFEGAQQMEVLEQREMDLFGNAALFTKQRYYLPLEHGAWVDEIVFAQRRDVLYRLELACRADQLARFEPIFTQFVSTFQFDCAQRP